MSPVSLPEWSIVYGATFYGWVALFVTAAALALRRARLRTQKAKT